MSPLLPALALAALCAPSQEGSETLSDGTLVVRTYRADASGERVLHGDVETQAPSGETIVTGQYKDGRRSGRWRFRYPDGQLAAAGAYRDGLRSGRWKFEHPNGKERAAGRFVDGRPVGEWEFKGEDGATLSEHSGQYLPLENEPLFEGFVLVAQKLGGSPHGPFQVLWPDGTLFYAGEFVRGRDEGDGQIVWPSGLLHDPDRERTASPLEQVFLDLDDAGRVRFPEGDPEATSASALAALPDAPLPARRAESPWPLAAIDVTANEYVDSNDSELAASFIGRLEPNARAVVPWALDALRDVDWEDPDATARARRVVERLLDRFGSGLARGWDWSGAEGASERNRRAVLASWLAYFTLGFEEAYWQIDAVMQPAAEPLETSDFPLERVFRIHRDEPSNVVDVSLWKQIGDAGNWLRSAQRPDGSWCADSSYVVPEDGGLLSSEVHGHDIGVTGLALLALVETGAIHTKSQETFAAARWLLGVQDSDTGQLWEPFLFPMPDGTRVLRNSSITIYEHLAGTWALCALLERTRSPRLEEAAQLAVRYIERSRNPYSGWRYTTPANGESDSSVTSWALAVLDAARRAGLDVSDEAFEYGVTFIDQMTDPQTGRVGYQEMGSPSARMLGVNEHIPIEIGEPLTALGLYARHLAGQTPEDAPVMKRHAELLVKTLPERWSGGRDVDHYYWHYGTLALARSGGPEWTKWWDALRAVLVAEQRVDGPAAGSWDPVGPWGKIGGRVYSTAVLMRALHELNRQPARW